MYQHQPDVNAAATYAAGSYAARSAQAQQQQPQQPQQPVYGQGMPPQQQTQQQQQQQQTQVQPQFQVMGGSGMHTHMGTGNGNGGVANAMGMPSPGAGQGQGQGAGQVQGQGQMPALIPAQMPMPVSSIPAQMPPQKATTMNPATFMPNPAVGGVGVGGGVDTGMMPQPSMQPQQQQKFYPPQQQQYAQQQQNQQYGQQQQQQQYGQTPMMNPNQIMSNQNNAGILRMGGNNNNTNMHVDINDQLLQESTRRMQESTHIMHGAMEANDLATTLERASAMLGELGDPKHHHHHHHHHHHGHAHGGQNNNGYGGAMRGNNNNSSNEPKAIMSPKHYYELHMMALDELPNLEEFFLSQTVNAQDTVNHANANGQAPPPPPPLNMTMKDLYEIVQYCPRAVPRLYLQICAGSALIRSGELREQNHDADVDVDVGVDIGIQSLQMGMSVKDVLKELKDGVKCVQCPIRGLFLRHYLLQAIKDKLPDESEVGDVVESPPAAVPAPAPAPAPAPVQEEEKVDAPVEHETEIVMETAPGLSAAPSKDDGEKMIDNFEKELDETMKEHTKALEDLMGGLGVGSSSADMGMDMNMNMGSNDHDSTQTAEDIADSKPVVASAVDNLMGDLGVVMGGTGGGLFDSTNGPHSPPPTNMPSMPPPAPMPMALPPPPVQVKPPVPAPVPVPVPPPAVSDPNAPGTVKDSYQFVLSNFIEMNKLWVRIQHMPGDSKTKETKRKRERERNELRMMVGTNLVRLSELEGVTSAVYGTIILPTVLDQIVACHDPLAQAYLMDCIIQVFPDEFHIQTLEVVLSVCPKLREKVNIRTILQSVMNRLANYYADELLLNDEEDTEGVKMSVMLDSYHMFDECIRSVLDARGAKLTAREAIRLESSLVDFSLKCYPGRMDYIDQALGTCASTLRGEGMQGIVNAGIGVGAITPTPIHMDKLAIGELEKLLSMPLEEMALNILALEHYSALLALLPWDNRKKVAITLLKALDTSGESLTNINEMDQLFEIMTPLLKGEASGSSINLEDDALVAKVIHLIDSEDTDDHFKMLNCAKKHITSCGDKSAHVIPLFYASLKLLSRIKDLEFPVPVPEEEPAEEEESIHDGDDVVEEVDGQSEDVKGIRDEDKEEQATPEDQVKNGDNAQSNDAKSSSENVEGGDEEVVKENTKVSGDGDVIGDAERDGDGIDEVSGDGDGDGGGIGEVKGDDDGIDEVKSDGDSNEGGMDATNVEDQPVEYQADKSTDIEEDLTEDKSEIVVPTEESAEDTNEPQPSMSELFDNSESDLFAETPLEEENTAAEKEPEMPGFTKVINCRKLFLFIQKLLLCLRETGDGEQTVNCLLNAAAAANSCLSAADLCGKESGEFIPIRYEFLTEAFLVYESSISDSKIQQRVISTIIGSLLAISKSFEHREYEALITKVTQYSARLLKKSDQCKMVMLCSHLFYSSEESGYRNPQRVLECLQRSLKVADACVNSSPSNMYLFVDILDCYLYHFEKLNPKITDRFISGLIALVNEHINTIGDNQAVADSKFQFVQTVRYIEEKKNDAATFSRFGKIVCKLPH